MVTRREREVFEIDFFVTFLCRGGLRSVIRVTVAAAKRKTATVE